MECKYKDFYNKKEIYKKSLSRVILFSLVVAVYASSVYEILIKLYFDGSVIENISIASILTIVFLFSFIAIFLMFNKQFRFIIDIKNYFSPELNITLKLDNNKLLYKVENLTYSIDLEKISYEIKNKNFIIYDGKNKHSIKINENNKNFIEVIKEKIRL